MKQSVDHGIDDHPDDEERAPTAWSLAVVDDCDGCCDGRVELSFEAVGGAGSGVSAHLAPEQARRVRRALATALRTIGEEPGP
ncbi:hypothetical protein BH18ACT4_BH18ACT4_11350 [soil metagenome]